MFEFSDLVVAFFLGALTAIAIISWLVHLWAQRIRRLLEAAFKEEDTVEPSINDLVAAGKVIPLKVEVDQDQYLCYNTLTNQFVCQGTNVTEIIDRFKSRFPGLNAALDSGDEQALATLRNQLKEHRENSNSIGSTS
jgi:hypothetical protein